MNNLVLKQEIEEVTLTSLEVAEMLGKEHYDLLKEIEGRSDGKSVGIIPILEKGNFPVSKYFIPSTYKSGTREYKCYEITKIGCHMLGNKLQGEKGILFTAKYVERFNEMEKQLSSGQAPREIKLNFEEKEIQTRFNNSLVRKANALLKITNDPLTTKERKKALLAQATEILTGSKEVKTLPQPIKKTYSATEIGKKLGISKQQVGRLTNTHNLKTDEFGMFFKEELKKNNKEVDNFRYYENVIPVLKSLLNVQVKLDI